MDEAPRFPRRGNRGTVLSASAMMHARINSAVVCAVYCTLHRYIAVDRIPRVRITRVLLT